MSLASFLLRARTAIVDTSTKIVLVAGNESADLDSVSSSLALAYSRSLTSSKIHIPVICIPMADLPVRPDVVYALSAVSLSGNHLFFIEDPVLDRYKKSLAEVEVILVDHNAPSATLKAAIPSMRVTEIIDHHADAGLFENAVRRISATGSCSSLIAKHIFSSDENYEVSEGYLACARLLLSAVVVDTICMNPSHGRFTDLDASAVEVLTRITKLDTTALFDDLTAAKKDTRLLTFSDWLKRDYKEFFYSPCTHDLKIGISSIGLDMVNLLKLGNDASNNESSAFEAHLAQFVEEKHLDCLFLMTAYDDPSDSTFKRELVMWNPLAGKNQTCFKVLKDSLLSDADIGLEVVQQFNSEGGGAATWFRMKNVKVSRKIFEPNLRAKINSICGEQRCS